MRRIRPSCPPASEHALSFNGNPGVTIPRGAVVLSEFLDFNVPLRTDMAVSLYFPGETGVPTLHINALHNTYVSKEGDATGAASIADPIVTQSYYWLAGIDVAAPPNVFLLNPQQRKCGIKGEAFSPAPLHKSAAATWVLIAADESARRNEATIPSKPEQPKQPKRRPQVKPTLDRTPEEKSAHFMRMLSQARDLAQRRISDI